VTGTSSSRTGKYWKDHYRRCAGTGVLDDGQSSLGAGTKSGFFEWGGENAVGKRRRPSLGSRPGWQKVFGAVDGQTAIEGELALSSFTVKSAEENSDDGNWGKARK